MEHADEIELLAIDRGGDQQLRGRWRTFKGRQFLDLRIFEAGKPTGKGVTIAPRDVAQVAVAMDEAVTRALRCG
jgi:hypothetical protein